MTATGPVEKALVELWPVAHRRLYSWDGLPTWFRLNWQFRLKLVRPSKVKVMVPTGTLPDCESCLDLCCTGPNALVSLRLRDIARLVDAGLEAYIAPRHADPSLASQPASRRMRRSPARQRLETSVFASIFPVLSRDSTLTCRLLSDSRRCGAWPHWPISCHRYPYAFDAEHGVVFLAKGCTSHRLIDVDDVPDRMVRLVDAAIDAYNQRIKDMIMLHVTLRELWDLGLLRYLDLDARMEAQTIPWGPAGPAPKPQNAHRRLPVIK